ncbi:MAG: MFS transporter [Alphaproteobacteria bacterium]|nr:MFS transporter [Alphaproteobacteria bacterium]
MTAVLARPRASRVMALISAAHFMSHVYNYCLPPLFPLLKEHLGVSYTELGLAMTAFAVFYGLGQTPAGFLVDRIGARAVLSVGLFIQSIAIALIGTVETYLALVVFFANAGLAHAVYHPADYAILSNVVDRPRLGRAFSVHSFFGTAGTAAVPLIMVALADLFDWRVAFMTIGTIGLLVALLVWTQGSMLEAATAAGRAAQADEKAPSFRASLALLATLPILLCFLFSFVMNIVFGGIRTFSVAALVDMAGTPLAIANGALTGFTAGVSFGVLLGGVLVDRIGTRVATAATGLVIAGALLALVGTVSLPIAAVVAILTAAGFARGAIQGTRDLMIFSVTPDGAHGRVFGFVSTGAAVGAAFMPLIYGPILDLGDPRWVFWLSGLLTVLAIATFFGVNRARRR